MNTNNQENQLTEYKDTLLNYKGQLDQALVEINNIVFEDTEQGVKEYKQNIAHARKLSKAIDQFRKDYKNYYLSLIEDDLNLLTDWTKLLDAKISNVSSDYDNWYTDLKIQRVAHAKELYQDLLDDYFEEDLSSDYQETIWYQIIEPKTFAKAMTDNKITDDINKKLQNFATDLKFIENKELFFECNLDKEYYLKELELIRKYTLQEQQEEQKVAQEELINEDTSIDTATITIDVADLPVVMKLLNQKGIKYEIN